MDDIIAAIGNWLTETHEGKRRAVSNLEWLFWIAAGIVGSLRHAYPRCLNGDSTAGSTFYR
ncbi:MULTISPECIES: hypothetical protein [unclassified Pseudomonas]|uniref:hypothetical protein n=1 Tax=unclassified Pseudomonas TaxID=196821 RepID=UPI0008767954|nr:MULTISPECIES: hypothetical protein [unclassified Pseudomonas]SCZ24014.1 hypothetical protein SAMN03159405_01076 [Pseudomonas sp. NFACC44-2]SDA67158.1 hypothetical protein SAMN03159429_02693 [Pseudomonas sp. NFACC51]SFJ20063.1 hypothetical protein SAMN03159302_05482 [Pseudomonas sp. NFACC54]SFS56913.1 hypothetical protein SAMN03159306_01189 [Pseudomonas sp. NFACC48-1]